MRRTVQACVSAAILAGLLLPRGGAAVEFAERRGDFFYDSAGRAVGIRHVGPSDIERRPMSHRERFEQSGITLPDRPLALQPRWVAAKPSRVADHEGLRRDEVVLKFVEGLRVRLRDGRLLQAFGAEAVLASYPEARVSRLFDSVEERILDENKETGERIGGRELADLNNYYRIGFPAPSPRAVELANELLLLDEVETAYLAPRSAEPPGVCADIPPTTPLWEASQIYLDPAPAGIDAEFAWAYHPAGDGYTVYWVIDIEYAWCYGHEDYLPDSSDVINGITVGGFETPDHGSGVLGEIVACDNAYGMTGTTSDITMKLLDVDTESSIAAAIALADSWQYPGEIILIEQQTYGPSMELLPVEWVQAAFDAIQTATANGVIVVEAAANGGRDLDSPVYGGLFNRQVRDSGAILAGGGAPGTHSPAGGTNWGSRVDVHGYGSGVWTTGYGHLFNQSGCVQDYTSAFNGTSAAAPIVTGACVALQCIANEKYGYDLTPGQMRTVLAIGGTPQGPPLTQNIGPMPDLADAINAIEPDLQPYQPAGWSHAAVPRSTADAVVNNVPLQAGPLPGNVIGTYWNWAMWNPPSAYSPAITTPRIGIALEDGFMYDQWPAGGWMPPNTWVWGGNFGPNYVKGGRHTVLTRADRLDTEDESDETNNDWSRQFIWSPLVLVDGAPVTRTHDPYRISTGYGPYYNAEGFSGTTGGAWWYAFAIMPENPGDDFDIGLSIEAPMNIPQQGFGAQQAYSAAGSGAVDFVVLDRNTVPAGTYWASGINYSGLGNKIVEFEGDAGTLFPESRTGPYTIATGHLIELHDVYLTAGQQHRIHVEWLSGAADYGVSVYDGTSGYHNKYSALTGGFADEEPAFADEFVIVAPPADDYYGVAVWKAGSVDLGESVTYNLIVSTSPNLTHMTPPGWHGPVVPRNTTDALFDWAPLPDSLIGNQPVTSYNISTYNEGPTTAPAPWQTLLRVDDVGYWPMPGSDLPPRSVVAWLNTPTGEPNSRVRGGRHHLRITADALGQLPEAVEDDNDYTEWFIWTPMPLGDGVPVVRVAPPVRDPIGHGPWPSCDGFRAVPGEPDWVGVGILPLSMGDDYDVTMHAPSTGSKDGFGARLVYSGAAYGQSDFVLVNYNHAPRMGMDYGVINYSYGSSDFVIQRSDGPFRVTVFPGTTEIGPYSIDPPDVLHVHEIYLHPDVIGPPLHFTLDMLEGDVDLGIAVFGADSPYYSRHEYFLEANTVAGGDEHAAPTVFPHAGYYAVVIYKTAAVDYGLWGRYRILISTDSPIDAPSVDPPPERFALAAPKPNPFGSRTMIRYDVPAGGGSLSVSIYDVLGRRVADLVQGPQPVGRHAVAWDGSDATGRRVAAGTYFVRLEAPEHRETRKITHLR